MRSSKRVVRYSSATPVHPQRRLITGHCIDGRPGLIFVHETPASLPYPYDANPLPENQKNAAVSCPCLLPLSLTPVSCLSFYARRLTDAQEFISFDVEIAFTALIGRARVHSCSDSPQWRCGGVAGARRRIAHFNAAPPRKFESMTSFPSPDRREGRTRAMYFQR